MTSRQRAATLVRLALVAVTVALALVSAACGDDADERRGRPARATARRSDRRPASSLIDAGKLAVGMNLQFKPQMYLDEPASRRATTSTCSTSSRLT